MITLNSISHSVAGRSLFHDISVSLSNRRYGLVGPSGIGKSTLARIVAGDLPSTGGQVISKIRAFYFAQSEPQDDMTLAEYLMEVWSEPTASLELISSLVGDVDLGRRLRQLSGGEWMRARLAKAISKSPGFFILDEPSNNLDRVGKDVVLQFLKCYSGGILLISHDRELLNQMDVILELSNQGLSIYGGNYNFYSEQRRVERERQSDKLESLKRARKKTERDQATKLDRQSHRMRTGADHALKGGVPKILLGAKKRQAQVSMGKLVRQEKDLVVASTAQVDESWASMKVDPFLRLDFEGSRVSSGKTTIAIHQLTWKYAGSESELWRRPIDLNIRGPQRWHIQGRNGSGKSTLAKLIATDQLRGCGSMGGTIQVNTARVAYLDQRYGLLDIDQSVIENVRRWSKRSDVELRNELAFYGFTGDAVFQKARTLSGGELLKVSLAQMFLGPIPEVVVLDEPTNNLDMVGIELLESAFQNFRGTILVISHDAEFAKALQLTHSLNLDEWISESPRQTQVNIPK